MLWNFSIRKYASSWQFLFAFVMRLRLLVYILTSQVTVLKYSVYLLFSPFPGMKKNIEKVNSIPLDDSFLSFRGKTKQTNK